MKRILLILLISSIARAQEVPIRGVVTYLSSGTVYISRGRTAGVQDSMRLFIISRRDTTAVLKVFAVSSKSAACTVERSVREPVVGDSAFGLATPARAMPLVASGDSVGIRRPVIRPGTFRAGSRLFGVEFEGRMSLQYYSTQFDDRAFDFSQPALVMNLRASSQDVPLSFEVYGNLRTLARAGESPFSKGATNQSRIYRLSLEYHDGANTVTAGRIMPLYAPSTGSIDGLSYMRRFGNVMAGLAVGYQPDPDQRGIASHTRKLSLFARYDDMSGFGLTAAYGRTYEQSHIDRETVTLGLSLYSSGGFSLYGYSDVDLRKKVSDRYEFSPALSTAIASASFSIASVATIGVGINMSRPLYPFSAVRLVADSLLDRTIRSGASLTASLTPVSGVLLSDTYSPRSLSGSFSRQYANYASASWYDMLSTGIGLRVSSTLSANEFSSGKGIGVHLQRSFWDVDISARYERSDFTILQLDETSTSESYGVDVLSYITRNLSFIGSYDLVRGYGPAMKSMFVELSWRF